MKSIATIYKDKKKEFRWRIKRAGRIVADSGEGYKTKLKCIRSLTRLFNSIHSDEVRIHDIITKKKGEK